MAELPSADGQVSVNTKKPNPDGLSPAAAEVPPDIAATAPGTLHVVKRNGKLVSYDTEKITVALMKAFLDVEGTESAMSTRVRTTVHDLSKQVTDIFEARLPSGGSVGIEEIQDQVELALMRSEFHKVARSYVLYREKKRLEREQEDRKNSAAEAAPAKGPTYWVTGADGASKKLSVARLKKIVATACAGWEGAEQEAILEDALKNLYEGIPESEVRTSLIISARALIEKENNHTYVAAQLLLAKLFEEVCPVLGITAEAGQHADPKVYARIFTAYIRRGAELELLQKEMTETFDLDALAAALKPERDRQFTYLGLQTLYDRYFIHHQDARLEMPQTFFMRVAMGLALREDDPTRRAIEFYDLISSFDYMASTPTLFNSGTPHSQLSSCYLTTVQDDLSGIYKSIHDNAMLSKWAGGLGNDWTPVRALGSYIKGTNGKSQGVVPFLKVVNDTAVAVNQGGKRKGATCSYLESWHLDIEEFLELRKNTGDDRRRTHDMHTANWVPDLFMERLAEDGEWTLFSPNDVPDLHDLCGRDFRARYEHYEKLADEGKLPLFKRVKAADLWRQMINMLFETGHPWITFKDPCNLRSPQQHRGVVHSSNLCTEITLNTSSEEIAVCNLGSVNLARHTGGDGLDLKHLERTVSTAVRMLDNVVDVNYYAVREAKNSNLKHRPVGLGIMGFQDALYEQRIRYNSDEAVEFADRSMEAVSYFAIKASARLARERGAYKSFEGSLWHQGVLPVDSLEILAEHRGQGYLEVDRGRTMDWDALREEVRGGMRNSNVLAIAPTATISNITGVTQSIEPTYANLYTKSNLSGEFTVINPYLVADLKKAKLWDNVMVNDIKFCDGSLQSIDRIPEEIKAMYRTAFEVGEKFIIEAASRRQKWIDQSQSLNIHVGHKDGKRISMLYRIAWQRGLKTTYYLRTLGATGTEKATVDQGNLNVVQPAANGNGSGKSAARAAPPAACAVDDPDCEACQ